MDLLQLALDEQELFAVAVIIASVSAVVIIGIIAETMHKSSKVRQTEESRREIAAYVAEGSISADDAAKLLHGENKSLGQVLADELT